MKTLQVIGLEHKPSTQSLWAPRVLDGCLPLAEDGVVHQVGCSVHAAEGVVDRLVSDCQRRVVGHNGVREEVLGVFAGHVLWRTHWTSTSEEMRMKLTLIRGKCALKY